MIRYEIRETGLFIRPHGYKVLTWLELPCFEEPQYMGSRFFDDLAEAEAYKKYLEEHEDNSRFTLF